MKSGALIQLIGAHDCLSARIGLAAGFDGVWASSLGLSTVAGRRDRNELSWTELVDAAGEIARSVDAPVILDANEGYGHDEIAKLIAVRARNSGVAGISLEDKRFPKVNSHEPGVELLDCAESVNRIRSCCDATGADDFHIIGRTDALVAGKSTSEAVYRAEAYHDAGASAIIVHSITDSLAEIETFMSHWSGRCPVLVIPTTFGSMPKSDYLRCGVGGLIWANQLIRSATRAMAINAKHLVLESNSSSLPAQMASLETVFDLSSDQWRRKAGESDPV